MKHEIPYDKVSTIYDKILDHIDYEDWVYYINEIFEHLDFTPNSILDLACGTGSFLSAFKPFVNRRVGIEISSGMINVAKKKVDEDLVIIEGDIREFEINEKFDLITCLLDSINYVTSLEEVQQVLSNASSHMNDGGIFIFDAVSQKACKEHFFNYTEKNIVDNIEYERYCHYDILQNIQYSEFTMNFNGDTYYEKHIQHIFDFNELIKCIEKSEFKLLNIYGDFELRPIDRYTERAHFVMRKS